MKGQLIYDEPNKAIMVFVDPDWKKVTGDFNFMYFDEAANTQIGHTIFVRDTVPSSSLGKEGDICLVRVV